MLMLGVPKEIAGVAAAGAAPLPCIAAIAPPAPAATTTAAITHFFLLLCG